MSNPIQSLPCVTLIRLGLFDSISFVVPHHSIHKMSCGEAGMWLGIYENLSQLSATNGGDLIELREIDVSLSLFAVFCLLLMSAGENERSGACKRR